jgi:uncharacterized OB-fold protein
VFERITDPAEVRRWDGGLPVAHRYTPGVAGEVFFTALRDRGVFLGSHCASCGYTYAPARLFCERDFSELSADVEVGPLGTIRSFTVAFVDADDRPLDASVTYALVQLDGADALFVHRLVGDGDDPIEIGARVELVLRAPAERTGSILDVEGFRVVPETDADAGA